jgi:hypothetical protein
LSADEEEEEAKGWAAIDAALFNIYQHQQPQHYAPTVYYSTGGSEPLDGISIYKNENHKCYHYVTYGFSELYEKETDNTELSGFGFELTFRLKYDQAETVYPIWPVNFLQNIAKVVFEKGLVFDDYHSLGTGPIKADYDTQIEAIIFITDPELTEINTEFGKVKFLQIFGLTSLEYESIRNKQVDRRSWLAELSLKNKLLITDLNRKTS